MTKGKQLGQEASKRQENVKHVNQSASERDAAGHYARTKHGSTNSGVTSANPRVISQDESGDATNKRSWDD